MKQYSYEEIKNKIEELKNHPKFNYKNKKHVKKYKRLYTIMSKFDEYNPKHNDKYKTIRDVKKIFLLKDVELLISRGYDKHNYLSNNEEIIAREKALACTFFLTGGRVSEIIDLKLSDFFIYYKEDKVSNDNLILEISLENKKNKRDVIKKTIANGKNEIYFIKGILEYYAIRLKNINSGLKIKDILTKKVSYDGLTDKLDSYFFVRSRESKEDILNNTNPIGYEVKKNSKISRNLIFVQFTKYYDCNPHYFRKLRATILSRLYNFNTTMLQKFMGWKTFDSSRSYIYLSSKDYVDKMSDKIR